jgi:hypothetical protein
MQVHACSLERHYDRLHHSLRESWPRIQAHDMPACCKRLLQGNQIKYHGLTHMTLLCWCAIKLSFSQSMIALLRLMEFSRAQSQAPFYLCLYTFNSVSWKSSTKNVEDICWDCCTWSLDTLCWLQISQSVGTLDEVMTTSDLHIIMFAD